MYAFAVDWTDENAKIANAIQATFAGVNVEIVKNKIIFRTDSDVTIVCIKAAYK